MKDFFIQITPLITIIVTAIIFYRFGRNDTRNQAIRNNAAVWTINKRTGKRTFEFLPDQNMSILNELDENDTQFNMNNQIKYVKRNYTR